jgi:hypothetical protein
VSVRGRAHSGFVVEPNFFSFRGLSVLLTGVGTAMLPWPPKLGLRWVLIVQEGLGIFGL